MTFDWHTFKASCPILSISNTKLNEPSPIEDIKTIVD